MKRVAARAWVFSVIGAAATILVAWLRALMPPTVTLAGETGSVFSGATWPAGPASDWPTPRRHEWTQRFAYREDWALADPDDGREWQFFGIRTGWPFAALTMREYWQWTEGTQFHCENAIERGIQFRAIRSDRALDGRLPILPVWPGFVGDTALYATLTWTVGLTGTAAVRLLRLRRSLSPRCAYPTGRSPVCTECGGSVRSKAEARA